ncbi:hypothetical protein [Frigoribacterium sp. Leaf44]|uniref:hypothetical protein n=1 Tax=Frigoribacterium sp. Leaf44 TaxID=1736220 RepID=UPI0012FA119C|nr:hypothetical protein [Frigoribacterium sp. Leaf44]
MKVQRFPRDRVVPATSSAAIASFDTAGGRLIPVIMVDATNHPEITELIRAHEHTFAGDCKSQWATSLGKWDVVRLQLKFERPVATEFLIEFQLPKFAGAIDNILRARSMYLLEGDVGSTFMSTGRQPRILVELPSTGFESAWQRIFHKSIVDMFREEGQGRASSRALASRFITDWRTRTTLDL